MIPDLPFSCKRCGWDGRTARTPAYRKAPHSWRNGVCAYCLWREARGLPPC